MGTNYYTKANSCKECGRSDEFHLGKSSAGWQFTFNWNGGEQYQSVSELKEWLKGKTIRDEYGDAISNKQFWDKVKQTMRKGNLNHCLETGGNDNYCMNIDGYSFIDGDFS